MAMLITIEGIEGVGKSTQVKLLENYFLEKKIPFVSTREPGGTKICEKIRNILLHDEMHPLTEILLYEAARAEHFTNIIEPALHSQKVVLCDRFMDASVAYQGYGRGIDVKLIENLNSIATKNTKPNLTFILDMDVENAFKRLEQRGSTPDRFEKLNKDFYEKVRKGYLDIASKEPNRVKIINSLQEIKKVHNEIIMHLKY
jgi:dTMP kinase